ncbi:uncharacterized protein GGS22DRAFT_199242 [Annulohypoxylon maeteangense]|uniref:uncharacterized protein n=1 Tax=Annulohypoxylon maeteangense TaxID=1927788 RepID=UPI002007BD92|nr:uncharacterized protein GGS22DRAFT_199242 [Annulohypoxylon maeteangense]KAI0886919.1 hypothetical protein GGS22DRAFT_199242 [Annulohypoxylon maeteangense]
MDNTTAVNPRRRYNLSDIQFPRRKIKSSTSIPKPSFQFFTRLPTELQLMIWDFWREQKGVVRHFIIYRTEGPCYGAYDVNLRRFITEEGSVDPMNVKINLKVSKHPVRRFNEWQTMDRSFGRRPPSVKTKSSFAWVNFEKDVFFTYDMLPHWWRSRYFSFGIHYSDWWRYAQRLTLCVNKEPDQKFYKYLPDELASIKTISILHLDPIKHRSHLSELLGKRSLLYWEMRYRLQHTIEEIFTRDEGLITKTVVAKQVESCFRIRDRKIDIEIV